MRKREVRSGETAGGGGEGVRKERDGLVTPLSQQVVRSKVGSLTHAKIMPGASSRALCLPR